MYNLPLWEPNDLEDEMYQKMRDHQKKYGGRGDWDSKDFVEKYLHGYLVLIHMAFQELRTVTADSEKALKKNNRLQNGLLREMKRLNTNLEKIMHSNEQLTLQFTRQSERLESVLRIYNETQDKEID